MSKIFTRLTLSYIMISVLMVAFPAFFSKFTLSGIFRRYESDIKERKIEMVVDDLVNSFEPGLMGWKNENLEKIGKKALEYGLITEVKDIKDNIVWSAYKYKNGADASLIKNMANVQREQNHNHEIKFVEGTYKIKVKEIVFGELNVGYYGSYYYSEEDGELLGRLNMMFFYTSLLSFVIAAFVGLYMSREIASPVAKVTMMTEMISKNDFKEKINFKSDIYEISALISSINILAETLENNRNLRKRMTSDVAHELRTPLAVLQSHLEAIIEGVWQPTPERLKSCYDEVSRLGKLVENLKKIDVMDSGSFVLDIKRFSLNGLLNSIFLNFGAEFKKKNISFTLKQNEEISLLSDSDHLRQVIINLLSNALKYTADGGNVLLSSEKKDGKIQIKVADDGIGISEKDLPFIFERLYRADTSRSKNTGGFGIGLTIAKYEVNALGGEIKVSSAEKKGTTFTVLLPEDIS